MFTRYKMGAMSGWNEKKIVNPSSTDLAHATPNVTHVAHINPNMVDVAPDVAHVSPHKAQQTSVYNALCK